MSDSTCFGQPDFTKCSTLLRIVSVQVAAFNCLAVTGRRSNCETLKTDGSSDITSVSVDFNGNLDKLSALA